MKFEIHGCWRPILNIASREVFKDRFDDEILMWAMKDQNRDIQKLLQSKTICRLMR